MSIIENIIKELQEGRPIILIDDETREDEGDLICPAEKVTDELLAFMMSECRGLICLSITEDRRMELGLPLQVVHNESVFGTNFAVPFDSVDSRAYGVTAQGRAETIRQAVKGNVKKADFVVPGFVVPVVARDGGVLRRRGQTEGSVDLSRLAGFFPAAVICEILDESGEPLRRQALERFSSEHNLLSCTVEDLVQYRLNCETNIRLVIEKSLDIEGRIREGLLKSCSNEQLVRDLEFKVKVFVDDVDNSEHFALCFGEYGFEEVLCRIHSECLTGDVFGSMRCDCGEQLDMAIEFIGTNKSGVILYLQQEGRGIGLANKIKAYELQEKGLDTFQANEHLGFLADARDYRVAAQMLKLLSISSVKLLTNNPSKISSLEESGIQVTSRVSAQVKAGLENETYLRSKVEKMGHLIDF